MSVRTIPAITLLLAAGLNAAAQAASFTTLYKFPGQPGPGTPSAVSAIGNMLIGTTSYGGSANTGTLYTLNLTTNAVTIVNDFDASMGRFPGGKLLKLGTTFYGATSETSPPKHHRGGGAGTVFRYSSSGGTTVLTTLDGSGPIYPNGDLAYHDGLLYGGSTSGPGNYGTLFQIDATTGAETTLYVFPGGTDGNSVDGGLLYSNGALYGAGSNGTAGAVFRFDLASATLDVLHLFTGGPSGTNDGDRPVRGLVDVAGKLYGATEFGGTADQGTIYEVDEKTGAETVVHSFVGGSDGLNPLARLTLQNGELYGTTSGGGTLSDGTIFQFDPATGVETILYSLDASTVGFYPGALTFYKGSFYGVTEGDSTFKKTGKGNAPYGAVFKFTP